MMGAIKNLLLEFGLLNIEDAVEYIKQRQAAGLPIDKRLLRLFYRDDECLQPEHCDTE